MIPGGFWLHAERHVHVNQCQLGHFNQQNKEFFQLQMLGIIYPAASMSFQTLK